MREYTAEEFEQLQQDVTTVRALWNQFKYEYQYGPDAMLHPPPVIVQASVTLLQEILAIGPESVEDHRTYTGLVNILAVLYQFGQFCQKRGVYDVNMLQCICCRVDDAALKEVLSSGDQ